MKISVEFVQDLPEMELVGRKIGPHREEEETEIRPWVAFVLEERGYVTIDEDFSATGIRKNLIREEKSPQLQEISPNFYLVISKKIKELEERGKKEEAEELRDVADSLISSRMKKIAEMAVSSSTPNDIPPEERFLSNLLSNSLSIWRSRLDSLFEKDSKKEAGVHERKVRRSIRRIVRNTANI